MFRFVSGSGPPRLDLVRVHVVAFAVVVVAAVAVVVDALVVRGRRLQLAVAGFEISEKMDHKRLTLPKS